MSNSPDKESEPWIQVLVENYGLSVSCVLGNPPHWFAFRVTDDKRWCERGMDETIFIDVVEALDYFWYSFLENMGYIEA